MEPESNSIDPAALNKARQIPKWARRYAHNRDFPYFFVRMGLSLLAFAVIGGSGKLAGNAAQEGYKTATLALSAICLASAILWVDSYSPFGTSDSGIGKPPLWPRGHGRGNG